MDPHVIIEFLQSAAATIAVGRLIYLGLAHRFPALLLFLALLASAEFAFGILNPASYAYFWMYVAYIPIQSVFSIAAVRELFALVFDKYPGIRTAGRWAMYVGITLSLAISLLLAKYFWSGSALGRSHSGLFYFEVAQRSIVFSLVVVIATILFFLSKYPLHLGRNTYVSSAFFSVLFLSDAARLLIDSLAPSLYVHSVDRTEGVIISLCLAGWVALLQPETARSLVPAGVPSLHEGQLLQQLDSLNQLMSRAARR